MTENELSKLFLDIAFKIHTALGPGLFNWTKTIYLTRDRLMFQSAMTVEPLKMHSGRI